MRTPEPLCYIAVYVWDELGEDVECDSYQRRSCAESFTYRECKEPELHLVIPVYARATKEEGGMVLTFGKTYKVNYGKA